MLRRERGVEDAHEPARLVHADQAVLLGARARDARLQVVEARLQRVVHGVALLHAAHHEHRLAVASGRRGPILAGWFEHPVFGLP